LDEETWSYIILNCDCLIFREINTATKFNDLQHMMFFFLLFILSYLLLRLPFVGPRSNILLLLFYFLNASGEQNWKQRLAI